jgi:hypothetical protein
VTSYWWAIDSLRDGMVGQQFKSIIGMAGEMTGGKK